MDVIVDVRITLKTGVVDAEGETVAKSLNLLGFPVKKVSTVQVYTVTVEAESSEKAASIMDAACQKLLANPVIQDFELTIK